jgi:hypothetical protein
VVFQWEKVVAQVLKACKLKNTLASLTTYKVLLRQEQKDKMMASLQDLKIYGINGTTLGLTTFTELEMSLKILLLIVTIGYTVTKWIDLRKNK